MIRYILLLITLFAFPAWASDGDFIRIRSTIGDLVVEYLLCDGAVNDTKTCSDFNVETMTPFTNIITPVGHPKKITFYWRSEGVSCVTPLVEIIGVNDTGGSLDTILAVLSEAGTSSFTPSQGVTHSVYRAAVTSAHVNCEDLEIGMRMEIEKPQK